MQASTCPCQNADLHQFVTACTLNAGGLWTVVVLHGIVVVWGTVMAIHTRSIPMLLFNESVRGGCRRGRQYCSLTGNAGVSPRNSWASQRTTSR